jgi:hypothetical protein
MYALPYEQWHYRFIDGIGKSVLLKFHDMFRTGEYRLTSGPVPTVPYFTPAAPFFAPAVPVTKADATVQPSTPGAVLISVPLTAYGDHKVTVLGRVEAMSVGFSRFTLPPRPVQVFEDAIQGPAPSYTKAVQLAAGSYRLKIVVKDTATGKLAGDTVDFEAK